MVADDGMAAGPAQGSRDDRRPARKGPAMGGLSASAFRLLDELISGTYEAEPSAVRDACRRRARRGGPAGARVQVSGHGLS
jgi:hypothetical protein